MFAIEAGFGPSALGITASDMRLRGRAFWNAVAESSGGAIEEGYPIDIAKAQLAAQRIYHEEGSRITPLVDPVDPAIIRKAVWGFRNDPDAGVRFINGEIEKAQKEYLKALDIAKAQTSSSSLMHTITDDKITMLFQRIKPLQALIPVTPNRGKTAEWDTYRKGASAFFGGEDPKMLTESDPDTEAPSKTVKIIYASRKITKLAIEAGRNQVPARDLPALTQMEMMEMIAQLRERRILGVSSDLSKSKNLSFTAANPLEYKGLYEIISSSTNDDANYTDVSSSTIDTWAKLLPYLENCYEGMIQTGLNPMLGVVDYKTFSLIRNAIYQQAHIDPVKEITWGLQSINLVFPNGWMPVIAEPILPSATGKIGCFFMLDLDKIERRVLWGETYELLSNENTATRGVVSACETLIDLTEGESGTDSLQGLVYGISR